MVSALIHRSPQAGRSDLRFLNRAGDEAVDFVSHNWVWLLLAIGVLLFAIRVDDEIMEEVRDNEKRLNRRKISLLRKMLRKPRKEANRQVHRP